MRRPHHLGTSSRAAENNLRPQINVMKSKTRPYRSTCPSSLDRLSLSLLISNPCKEPLTTATSIREVLQPNSSKMRSCDGSEKSCPNSRISTERISGSRVTSLAIGANLPPYSWEQPPIG